MYKTTSENEGLFSKINLQKSNFEWLTLVLFIHFMRMIYSYALIFSFSFRL